MRMLPRRLSRWEAASGWAHSRREALHVHDLLHQTESGTDHGLRCGELITGQHIHICSKSENELTVARIPKT